jgi:hypothetical protein
MSLGSLIQRGVASLHMTALAAQTLLALLLLANGTPTLRLHSLNAILVVFIGMLQLLCMYWWSPSRNRFCRSAAVLVLLAELVQIELGRTGHLAFHVTMATVIWGLSVWIFIQVWAPTWGRLTVDLQPQTGTTS